MDIALALVIHDPAGRLADQIDRTFPALTAQFAAIAVQASRQTAPGLLARLTAHGVRLGLEGTDSAAQIGRVRRHALALALPFERAHVLYCDFDRLLHWFEFHPHELFDVAARIGQYDFTVLGRTARAFNTHPRLQRDTEAIINHVYQRVSGRAWDTGAGARGLSRRAAETIIAQSADDTQGNDVTWPLLLQHAGDFALGYVETEGLEFETADRFADEVAAAGGLPDWIDQLDDDPAHWAARLELARVEVAAMIPFARS